MLDRSHYLTIACFTGLFMVLYFGCDTKSKEHKALEKSRVQKFELISIDRVIAEAKPELPASTQMDIQEYEKRLKLVETDSQKVSYLRALASLWFGAEKPLISGSYAEQIADIENDLDAWSITGTTYSIAAQRLQGGNEKDFAIGKSRLAFEKALSLDPENTDNKINLALSYVEAPLEENPMKGILMLVDMNKKDPENIPVLMQLGRLSLKTGQYEKAVERLTKVIELRPTLKEAHCLLAEVLRQKGEPILANKAQQVCDKQ